MTERQLIARDSKRDIGAELLRAVREMKTGNAARVHRVWTSDGTAMTGAAQYDGSIGSPSRRSAKPSAFAKGAQWSEDGAMAKRKKRAPQKLTRLKPIVALGEGFVLAKTTQKRKSAARGKASESTSVLIRNFAQALKTPGIRRSAIFPKGVRGRFYIYSVDPDDPSQILRIARDGSRSVGLFAGGRFRVR